MKNQFILLTQMNNAKIIVGVANIAFIEPIIAYGTSEICLNISISETSGPLRLVVKESFAQIQTMIGL